MIYVIQELLKGNVILRTGQQQAIEEITNLIDRQIPINITYMNEDDINIKNWHNDTKQKKAVSKIETRNHWGSKKRKKLTHDTTGVYSRSIYARKSEVT